MYLTRRKSLGATLALQNHLYSPVAAWSSTNLSTILVVSLSPEYYHPLYKVDEHEKFNLIMLVYWYILL